MAEGNRALRTLGVMRPRTHVFLEFQKAKKLSPTRHHDSGRLLAGVGRSDNSPIDNLSAEDPPQWTEAYAKTSTLLKNIDQDLIRLKSAQQQRLQMAFGDVRSKEREVATLSSSVTTVCTEQLVSASGAGVRHLNPQRRDCTGASAGEYSA